MSSSVKYLKNFLEEYMRSNVFTSKLTVVNPPILLIDELIYRNNISLKQLLEEISKEKIEKFFKALFTHLYEIKNPKENLIDIISYNENNDKFKTNKVYYSFIDTEIIPYKKSNNKKNKEIFEISKLNKENKEVIQKYFNNWISFTEKLLPVYSKIDKELTEKIIRSLSKSRKFKEIYKIMMNDWLVKRFSTEQKVNEGKKIPYFTLFSVENYENPFKDIISKNFIENITKFTPEEIIKIIEKINNNTVIYKDPKKDYGLVNQIRIKPILFFNEEDIRKLIEYFNKKGKNYLNKLIYNLRQANIFVILKENEKLFFNREFTIKERGGIPLKVIQKLGKDKKELINKILDELKVNKEINNFNIKIPEKKEKEFLGL